MAHQPDHREGQELEPVSITDDLIDLTGVATSKRQALERAAEDLGVLLAEQDPAVVALAEIIRPDLDEARRAAQFEHLYQKIALHVMEPEKFLLHQALMEDIKRSL